MYKVRGALGGEFIGWLGYNDELECVCAAFVLLVCVIIAGNSNNGSCSGC